jgi:hypothetical protein
MKDQAPPAYKRRLRLSTGAICAAVVLTGAALLAIAAVERSGEADAPTVAVRIEGPLSEFAPAEVPRKPDDSAQASSDDGRRSDFLSR